MLSKEKVFIDAFLGNFQRKRGAEKMVLEKMALVATHFFKHVFMKR
jgi:hypothetical protein